MFWQLRCLCFCAAQSSSNRVSSIPIICQKIRPRHKRNLRVARFHVPHQRVYEARRLVRYDMARPEKLARSARRCDLPVLFGLRHDVLYNEKGTPYVKGIFRRRFLSLFAHFDIAVLLFLLMNLALGIKTKTRTTLLAFTTWESIGNSNWYITAVLCLYLIFIVSFLIFRKHHIPGLSR